MSCPSGNQHVHIHHGRDESPGEDGGGEPELFTGDEHPGVLSPLPVEAGPSLQLLHAAERSSMSWTLAPSGGRKRKRRLLRMFPSKSQTALTFHKVKEILISDKY